MMNSESSKMFGPWNSEEQMKEQNNSSKKQINYQIQIDKFKKIIKIFKIRSTAEIKKFKDFIRPIKEVKTLEVSSRTTRLMDLDMITKFY